MMAHFCDKMMFFPWVPFIQMHMVINVSLNLIIGTWIQTNKVHYENNCVVIY
jgi:hypothetical protein